MYFNTFLPKNSPGESRYPIRNPRWQPPAHRHTYITSTSRYQLAVLLNSINDTHDMMSNVIEHIGIISLLSFKATIKRYLNNKNSYYMYCSIINICVISVNNITSYLLNSLMFTLSNILIVVQYYHNL